ncbi:scavenger receptor cysteine-rich type 1 protein M130-like isoform X2 [Rhinatrema bivittatum]|uniref:scavenger receptor cysteine-rich type 1 protein M130-like isoform X2 n=1 Tax=Rhinatrema bivittatum TaxID=194408 RepID=UPI00112BCAB7|nr:scavenger receptor cysteine-rich type 1 protein M130-like isoform X2 [Rhinatrema bivittatum]
MDSSLLWLLGWLRLSAAVVIAGGIQLRSSLMSLHNWTWSVGGRECEGLVRLSTNGTHSLVCDEHWSLSSPLAYVVCQEADCGAPVGTWKLNSSQYPSMPVVRGVRCKGIESSVNDCLGLEAFVKECNQANIAALTCIGNNTFLQDHPGNETARLVGGRSQCDGHLEILLDVQWGFVCSAALKKTQAKVLCKQIGCKSQQVTIAATSFSPHPRDVLPLWSDNFVCQGNETSIWDCQRERHNSCFSGQHVYLQCQRGRLEESWLIWLTIAFAALMIAIFCWVKVLKSCKSSRQTLWKYIRLFSVYVRKLWNSCLGTPTRRRRKYQREPPEIRVQEMQSSEDSPTLIQNSDEVNALLAPYGFRLHNTITPPPSYMNALKVLSRPLENTQTPPPSYLEALKVLSRPVIVHVPAAQSLEDEELVDRKDQEKQNISK